MFWVIKAGAGFCLAAERFLTVSAGNAQTYLTVPFYSSFGRIIFSNIAMSVANTTGDLPKIMVAQLGKVASAADACEMPIPRAAARPTMEVFL